MRNKKIPLPLQAIHPGWLFQAEHFVLEACAQITSRAGAVSKDVLFEAPSRPGRLKGLIALDEVGRGCLAGPVVAAASLWLERPASPSSSRSEFHGTQDTQRGLDSSVPWLAQVRDSKKVPEARRETLFACALEAFPHLGSWSSLTQLPDIVAVRSEHLSSASLPLLSCSPPSRHGSTALAPTTGFTCKDLRLGACSAAEIDSLNIWRAVQLAMGRALMALLDNPVFTSGIVRPEECVLTIDGKNAIAVPRAYARCQQVAAVGGDDLLVSVGLSSVVAKVLRDREMAAAARAYPEYGFERHKGYATEQHREAIKRHDCTPLHRRSFLRGIRAEAELSS